MTEEKPRKPTAFNINPSPRPEPKKVEEVATVPRRPVAVKDLDRVVPEADIFETLDDELNEIEIAQQLRPKPRSRAWTLGGVFMGAMGILISFAVGIWTDDLIRALFDRAAWLGWTGLTIALIALIAFLVIIARELLALRRLASVQKLQEQAADAAERDDMKASRKAVDELLSIASTLPQTARGRQTLDGTTGEIIDGRDLIRLAETELLRPLDREARALVLGAAKRVSLVTAVSPRAFVDIGYVMFESARLIRRLSQLYGGRPGTLGFLRLIRNVLAHLAITGTIAMGDSVVQQLVGQGLASRLSAKLGEGVVNGLMTARIGIAAMDVVRPFPFIAEKRPGISDFVGDLARLSTEKQKETRK